MFQVILDMTWYELETTIINMLNRLRLGRFAELDSAAMKYNWNNRLSFAHSAVPTTRSNALADMEIFLFVPIETTTEIKELKKETHEKKKRSSLGSNKNKSPIKPTTQVLGDDGNILGIFQSFFFFFWRSKSYCLVKFIKFLVC